MFTVACVWTGHGFARDYVVHLHDMVRRNLPEGFAGRFVCLTDRPADLKGCEGIEAWELNEPRGDWFDKLALFRPNSPFFPHERVWYFDLDTVITGPLDDLFKYGGAFALLEDVYRPGGFGSGVMSFRAKTTLTDSIWLEWLLHGSPCPQGGDQAVLEMFWRSWLPTRLKGDAWPPDFLQRLYPGALRSYKVDCVWTVPPKTSVVFFHGRPRPHEVITGWVPNVWRIGGGSALELVQVGTVPQDRILANVRHCLAQDYPTLGQASPENDQTAVIVGGSPSLAQYVILIANLQHAGAVVFACNQVDGYLRAKCIKPNVHVMLDARPDLVQWVNREGLKCYASMCDPATLARADELGDLQVFHKYTDGIEDCFPAQDRMLIGGGTTVGVSAMALAYAMGFRKILCFGMDSSYADGRHHAYAQGLNDGETVIDCAIGGAHFKAAPWMVQQARDWKALTQQLLTMGCMVGVYGDGLIPKIAETLRSPTVEIDGILWPSGDVEARESVLRTLPDLRAYIALCHRRRVAIQAGGNVGLWPMELSKHFDVVHTFEPEPVNFDCLCANVKARNVYPHHAALGAASGRAGLERSPANCGAHRVVHGTEVDIVTIDGLDLDHVDFIQLDVEGYELEALKGARETLIRCSPLLVLEMNGLNRRYGAADSDIDAYLSALGYHRTGAAHRDVIYERTPA